MNELQSLSAGVPVLLMAEGALLRLGTAGRFELPKSNPSLSVDKESNVDGAKLKLSVAERSSALGANVACMPL